MWTKPFSYINSSENLFNDLFLVLILNFSFCIQKPIKKQFHKIKCNAKKMCNISLSRSTHSSTKLNSLIHNGIIFIQIREDTILMRVFNGSLSMNNFSKCKWMMNDVIMEIVKLSILIIFSDEDFWHVGSFAKSKILEIICKNEHREYFFWSQMFLSKADDILWYLISWEYSCQLYSCGNVDIPFFHSYGYARIMLRGKVMKLFLREQIEPLKIECYLNKIYKQACSISDVRTLLK